MARQQEEGEATPVNERLGAAMEAALDRYRVTKAQVARDLNTDPSVLARYYNGTRAVTVEFLVRFTEAVGVPIEELGAEAKILSVGTIEAAIAADEQLLPDPKDVLQVTLRSCREISEKKRRGLGRQIG